MTFFSPPTCKKLTMLGLTGLLLMAFAMPGMAIRFYYGTLSWKKVAIEGLQPGQVAVRFLIGQAGQRSFDGNPNVGDTRAGGNLVPGFLSAPTVPITLTVTSINTAEDWYYGEFEATVIYPNAGVFTAQVQASAKANFIGNNANQPANLFSTVDLTNPANNNSPVVNGPPIIPMGAVGSGIPNFFEFDAIDLDNPSIEPTYTITPNGSFGGGQVQPPPAGSVTITPTGTLTFNTASKPVGSFWNTNITVSDGQGATTQIDFLMQVVGSCLIQGKPAPVFKYTSTPADGQTFTTTAGQNLSFKVSATDNTPGGASITLSVSGLPDGATTSPALQITDVVNPIDVPDIFVDSVTTTFNWTPSEDDYGSYQVVFAVTDVCRNITRTIVNIRVLKSPFTPKANFPEGCIPTGQLFQANITGLEEDLGDKITFSTEGSVPAGMTFSPSLPYSSASNSDQVQVNWTPTNTNWGLNELKVKITDDGGLSSSNTFTLVVNDPPSLPAAPAIPNATQGVAYNTTISVTDPNIGSTADELQITSSGLPTGLTATISGTTITISGTTNVPPGDYPFTITVTDAFSDECGAATEDYTLTVVAAPPPPDDCENCSFSQGKFFNSGGANSWPDVNGSDYGNVTIGGYTYTEAEARGFAATSVNCSGGDKTAFIFRHGATLKLSKTCTTLVTGGKTIAVWLADIDAYFAAYNKKLNSSRLCSVKGAVSNSLYNKALAAANALNAFIEANHCDDGPAPCTVKLGNIKISNLVTTKCNDCNEITLYDGYKLNNNKFSVSVSGGSSPYTYSWSPAKIFVDATVANPVIKAGTTGAQTITVTVKDKNGCEVKSKSIKVTVINVKCTDCGPTGVWVCVKTTECKWVKVRGCWVKQCTTVWKSKCVKASEVDAYLCKGACLGKCGSGSNREGNGLMEDALTPLSVKVPVEDIYDGPPTIQVYPNPSRGNATIVAQGYQAGQADIRVIATNGSNVLQNRVMLQKGRNTIPLQLGNKAKGFYLVQLVSESGIQTVKLLLE
ncbi:MAG TPA: putative Ig domain-containing protein [Phnomibacter sp.]|nr:putative Ig domain-containing protein [Phnomibacter sp.]